MPEGRTLPGRSRSATGTSSAFVTFTPCGSKAGAGRRRAAPVIARCFRWWLAQGRSVHGCIAGIAHLPQASSVPIAQTSDVGIRGERSGVLQICQTESGTAPKFRAPARTKFRASRTEAAAANSRRAALLRPPTAINASIARIASGASQVQLFLMFGSLCFRKFVVNGAQSLAQASAYRFRESSVFTLKPVSAA